MFISYLYSPQSNAEMDHENSGGTLPPSSMNQMSNQDVSLRIFFIQFTSKNLYIDLLDFTPIT